MEEPAPAGAEMASVESDLLVTETMGDVYAAQGHHAEAMEVYRQLLVRSPDDAGLKAKVSRLERRTPPPAAAKTPSRIRRGANRRAVGLRLFRRPAFGAAGRIRQRNDDGPGGRDLGACRWRFHSHDGRGL